MNKIQKTYIENELKEQEIKIYSLIKNDMEYIIKEVEKHGLDVIKCYVNCVDKKLISLKENKNEN